MKTIVSVALHLTLLMSLMIVPARAENEKQPNSEQLKRKIERLESVDLNSKSSTVEDMYRKMLFGAYDEYRSALEQELADLRQLVSIAGENQKVGSDEAVSLIRKLSEERNLTIEKIKILHGDTEAKTASTSAPESNVSRTMRDSNPDISPGNTAAVRTSLPP